jgi:hypothetical protein
VENGYKFKSPKNAAKDWRRLGLKHDRKSAGAFWLGAKLPKGEASY